MSLSRVDLAKRYLAAPQAENPLRGKKNIETVRGEKLMGARGLWPSHL